MKLAVRHLGQPDQPIVGKLADDPRGRIFFEFDPDWRSHRLDLSPIRLPLTTSGSLSTPTPEFSPLFGLFDDSLPDWWGQRIMRLHFAELNLPWNQVTPLEKLACQGAHALGSLAYEPDLSPRSYRETLTTEIVDLVTAARQLMHGDSGKILPALIRGGLSPGGAQPKALVAFNEDLSAAAAGGAEPPAGYSRWLVKFQIDPEDTLCREEHAIALMASAAGIRVPETRLFQSAGAAHFLSRRFDRTGQDHFHLHSYAGLTHTPVRDLIDYNDLLDLTRHLTGREEQIEEMFRRAVFNIAIANDDDHSRNHAFLMDPSGEWSLSPAYDMTRTSYALGSGFRAAGILGNHTNLTRSSLLALGKNQALRRPDKLIDQVLNAIRRWPEFADQAGIPDSQAALLATEFPAADWI